MRKCNNCGTEFYNPATTVCNVCNGKLPPPPEYNITNEIKECSRCGFANQVNSLFCSNCGYNFNALQQNSTPNTPNTDKKNTNDENITSNSELVDNTQNKEGNNRKDTEGDNKDMNNESTDDDDENTNNISVSDTYQTQPPVENLLNKKKECPKCGFDNPVNNIFCSNCGNKIEDVNNYYKEQEKKQGQENINNNQQGQYNNNVNNAQTQNQYNNQKQHEESFLKKALPFILLFVFIGISSIIYVVMQNTDNFEKVSADYNVIMQTKIGDLATSRDLDKYIESLANIHVRIKKLLEKEKDSTKISTLYEYDKKIGIIYNTIISLKQTINSTIQKYATVNNLDIAKKCKNELNYIYNESSEYIPKILYTLIEEKFDYCHKQGLKFAIQEMYNYVDTLANKMNKYVADKYVGGCMWRVKGSSQEISKNRETRLDGLTLYVTTYHNAWAKCFLGKEFTDVIKMNGKIYTNKDTFEIKYSY